MSVVNVKAEWETRPAGKDSTGRWAERGYTVLLTDPADGELVALAANGIPRRGQSHPQDSWLVCKDVHISQWLSPVMAKIVARFELRGETTGDGDYDSPLKMPAEISYRWETSREPIDEDANGEPIVNSSGEPFDPPIEENFEDLVMTITQNEATFDPAKFTNYNGRTNSKEFGGFAAGLVKMKAPTGDEQQQGAAKYFRVTWTFVVRNDGWKRRQLDRGFRELVGVDADGKPKYTQIKDTDGNPISEPALLDGNGRKLAKGHPAVWLNFQTKKTADFNDVCKPRR